MNRLKVLKTESDYKAALARFEELLDAARGSPEYDERDVLAVLIERYEDEHHPVDPPDPREAIKFRMEQMGLSRKDVAPYFGGKSKVSEVMSGRRELALATVRQLHEHLGIPAEVLIRRQPEPVPASLKGLDFGRFPLREMEKHGAFRGFGGDVTKDRSEESIRWLAERAGGFEGLPAVGFRSTADMRINSRLDGYALMGWSLQVLAAAREPPVSTDYLQKALTREFFRSLASLSVLDDGPRSAQSFLSKIGISLIVIPHLKHTYLDGAVFLPRDGRPVIGLTLRYDRLDNFWFVLFHELGHLACGHLTKKRTWIVDDLDMPGHNSVVEAQADQFAIEHLLPQEFDLHRNLQVTSADIIGYATENAISPAIVAGRIQHERKDYRTFSQLVGRGMVRRHFYPGGSADAS
jgi:HTH-type transcriptional regulator / antitoxin HigA